MGVWCAGMEGDFNCSLCGRLLRPIDLHSTPALETASASAAAGGPERALAGTPAAAAAGAGGGGGPGAGKVAKGKKGKAATGAGGGKGGAFDSAPEEPWISSTKVDRLMAMLEGLKTANRAAAANTK